MSPFWILLELRKIEAVATTSAARCANLQSNPHMSNPHKSQITQITNPHKSQSNPHKQYAITQLFTSRMPFLSPIQQCQSKEGHLLKNT